MNEESVSLCRNDTVELLQEGLEPASVVNIVDDDMKCTSGKFENYWKAVENLLDEGANVPDERRHGLVNYIAPTFISVRHLHENASKRMYELFPGDPNNNTPSQEYLRYLQFFNTSFLSFISFLSVVYVSLFEDYKS